MVAAVAENEHVIPRSLISISIAASGLLAQPPLEGVVTNVTANAAKVLWSNGALVTGLDVTDTTVCPLLRVAAPSAPALAAFSGQVVQLDGQSGEFCGPVVQVLSIELDPVGAPGDFTDSVVVRSRGTSQAFFVAPVADVSVVD